MEEMYAISSVHQRNSKAYGVNSEPAKDFRKKGESQRNELPLMRTAIVAEIKSPMGIMQNGRKMLENRLKHLKFALLQRILMTANVI